MENGKRGSRPDGKTPTGFAAKMGDVLDSKRMCCNLREAWRACIVVLTNATRKVLGLPCLFGINKDLM